MADIERHAKLILLRAQQQAEQLLAAAQGEAESLKLQAVAEGTAEGRRQGMAEGTEEGRKAGQQQALGEYRAQFQQVMQALTGTMLQIDQHRADLEADGLAEVVRLSLAIARRITKRQGMLDPKVLESNLQDAMKLVVSRGDLRIAVHPAQRATLEAVLPQLQLQWPALTHVQLVEDAALAPGGCRIFSENGAVDADLETQLDRMAVELLPAPEPTA